MNVRCHQPHAFAAQWSNLPVTTSCTADIWLVVSVPVLSEQITVVQPSVSTLGSFLTIAFRFAIFLQGAIKNLASFI
jgi:hypothetical protein